MQTIIEWLNTASPDYYEGVKLYMQYGRDEVLKRSFVDEPESLFKRKKLRSALQVLASSKRPYNRGSANIPDKVFAPENYKYWPPFPITDKVVAALYNQWKPIYISMIDMQSQLYEIALAGKDDKNKRMDACQLAHKILDLDDKCDCIYERRDYYYVHGQLPDAIKDITDQVVGDPVRLATMMKNAERYVREFRLKCKKNPGNDKMAAKLLRHEESVAQYRKLLKLDNDN